MYLICYQCDCSVAVCIFLSQQIWSHLHMTYNKLIIQPNFMNVLVLFVFLIHIVHPLLK